MIFVLSHIHLQGALDHFPLNFSKYQVTLIKHSAIMCYVQVESKSQIQYTHKFIHSTDDLFATLQVAKCGLLFICTYVHNTHEVLYNSLYLLL